MKKTNVMCPYCAKPAVLADSAEVYHGRSYGMIWICRPCGAYVGCHKNSKDHAPKGSLANAELRPLRIAAHAAFDPLWKSGDMKRKEAYAWLKAALDVDFPIHIGESDVDMCHRIITACANHQDVPRETIQRSSLTDRQPKDRIDR